MNSTWIVIGHRAGARILRHTRTGFRLVSEISHDTGRLKDSEIYSDRPGRVFDRTGSGRHAISSEETAHEHDATVFAREIAEKLRVARHQQRFDRLVLVAEPRFLGRLRAALDEQTEALVDTTVGKDLAQVPLHELMPHLRGEVSLL
jgi:protein required for attachment to host cells